MLPPLPSSAALPSALTRSGHALSQGFWHLPGLAALETLLSPLSNGPGPLPNAVTQASEELQHRGGSLLMAEAVLPWHRVPSLLPLSSAWGCAYGG